MGMKFEESRVSDPIKANLAEMGFVRPTDIQYKALLPVQKGEDVFAVAQTGTGKTAAYAIPLVDRIHRGKSSRRTQGVRCLVMVPTRELAAQTGQVFNRLARNTRVAVLSLHGGVEQEPQIARLNTGVDVLVATPGRLFDLAHQGIFDLGRVHTLVLDEADRMLDLGFVEDIRRVKRMIPRDHQTLFVSATINPDIKKIAYDLIRSQAIRIQISPDDPVSKNVEHAVIHVKAEEKRAFLARFLMEHPSAKVVVFLRTRLRVERVAAFLAKSGHTPQILHGELAQDERTATLGRFSEAVSGLLLATDVSARGIDIPGVQYVINFDLPDDPEVYVHRIGRTGRGHSKGSAIAFCSPDEQPKLDAIEHYLGTSLPVVHLGKSEYSKTLALFPEEGVEDPKAFIREYENWVEQRLSKKRKGRKKG